MLVRWSTHARTRALERFGIEADALEHVRVIIEERVVTGQYESWWEHDSRDWRGEKRGDVLNKVVQFLLNEETVYAVVRDDDPAWICTLLYQGQYRHNRSCGMWTKSRDNLSSDSQGPMSFRPFAKLRRD